MKTLIDNCVDLCGTQRRLAETLNIQQQDVHEMCAGKRVISPTTVGLLCDVLGVSSANARRLAITAIIANAKPEKQATLIRAFSEKSPIPSRRVRQNRSQLIALQGITVEERTD